MMKTPIRLQPGDALLVGDVQNDFMPGGALPVPRGDEVIEPLNRYIAAFTARKLPVFAIRDWHPPDHCSFRDRGGPWPRHCVQGTAGAAFAPALRLPGDAHIISKAGERDHEAYSAFVGTPLDTQLFAAGVRRLFLGGVATDFCVRHTALDALRSRYAVVLLHDAVRAINVHPGDGTAAESEIAGLGGQVITFKDLAA
jgi:nicotinamidase/pyrazinamidase